MDFSKPPWSDVAAFVRTQGVQILIIVIVAFIVLRVARLTLRGIFKALLDREATEGTAQELSAIEVRKRLDTLDRLGGNVLGFFVIVIAGLMILTTIGINIGPAIAGLGVVGIAVGFGTQSLIRDYMNGCLILIENQFSRGDVVTVAGRHRHGRGLQPPTDDAARPRRGRPHGPERPDPGRLEPDADVGPDQPERRRPVRDRRRQGDRGRERSRPGDGQRPRNGSAGSSSRRGSTASSRSTRRSASR
jgi:hypothetical protein